MKSGHFFVKHVNCKILPFTCSFCSVLKVGSVPCVTLYSGLEAAARHPSPERRRCSSPSSFRTRSRQRAGGKIPAGTACWTSALQIQPEGRAFEKGANPKGRCSKRNGLLGRAESASHCHILQSQGSAKASLLKFDSKNAAGAVASASLTPAPTPNSAPEMTCLKAARRK